MEGSDKKIPSLLPPNRGCRVYLGGSGTSIEITKHFVRVERWKTKEDEFEVNSK